MSGAGTAVARYVGVAAVSTRNAWPMFLKRMTQCATAIAAIAMLAGCATGQGSFRTDSTSPSILVATRDAGVRDLRGAYRAAVCRRLTAEASACEDVLLRLAGEPAAAALPSAGDLA